MILESASYWAVTPNWCDLCIHVLYMYTYCKTCIHNAYNTYCKRATCFMTKVAVTAYDIGIKLLLGRVFGQKH